MSTRVTLELPDEVAHRASEIATRAKRSLEDVLTEWIERIVTDGPAESLSDGRVLALANLRLDQAF